MNRTTAEQPRQHRPSNKNTADHSVDSRPDQPVVPNKERILPPHLCSTSPSFSSIRFAKLRTHIEFDSYSSSFSTIPSFAPLCHLLCSVVTVLSPFCYSHSFVSKYGSMLAYDLSLGHR